MAALALGICVGYFLGGQSSTQSFLAQKISAPAKTLPALEPPAVSAKAPQVANASKVPWPPQHRNSGKLPKQLGGLKGAELFEATLGLWQQD